MSAIPPDELFLRELSTIEGAIRRACRRGRLYGADAEDFESHVKLKLIENDYAILRKFEGLCSFQGYISVVVKRFLLDLRNHTLGKWHASAEAKRLGETAMQLEQLLHRDRLTLDEAVQLMLRGDATLERETLVALSERLPRRRTRLREVGSEALEYEPAGVMDEADSVVLEQERVGLGRTVSVLVREAIDSLPEEDRLIFRLRYEEGMTVAQVSRTLKMEQKPLYRRIEHRLREFRQKLETAGVRASFIDELIDQPCVDLDFGLLTNATACPSDRQWGVSSGSEEENRA
ncbi:MAG TPA: sigma-70 family RNA polymerase sigma factor [Thermoanaerobaculia bacterium]